MKKFDLGTETVFVGAIGKEEVYLRVRDKGGAYDIVPVFDKATAREIGEELIRLSEAPKEEKP